MTSLGEGLDLGENNRSTYRRTIPPAESSLVVGDVFT